MSKFSLSAACSREFMPSASSNSGRPISKEQLHCLDVLRSHGKAKRRFAGKFKAFDPPVRINACQNRPAKAAPPRHAFISLRRMEIPLILW
jgi:hypothetical protein